MPTLSFITKTKNIIKQYGTGYYRATLLFPADIKQATWTLYTFVRLADEIVDHSSSHNEAQVQLASWIQEWHDTKEGKQSSAVFAEFLLLCQKYQIPSVYVDDFLSAMDQDLRVERYESYADLEQYMYGSAVTVGYMMSHIIGYSDGALVHARALGEAMQLTNILRDIREDYEERGRIYLPQEDLRRFGITEEDIKNHRVDDRWRAYMCFEVARARALFINGNAGIPMLNARGRAAVRAASALYEGILDQIETAGYDVFAARVRVSPFRKTVLLLRSLWNI